MASPSSNSKSEESMNYGGDNCRGRSHTGLPSFGISVGAGSLLANVIGLFALQLYSELLDTQLMLAFFIQKRVVGTSRCRWIVGSRCPFHMVRLNVWRGVRLGLFRCVFVVAHRQFCFCYTTYVSTVILRLIVGSRRQNRHKFFEK